MGLPQFWFYDEQQLRQVWDFRVRISLHVPFSLEMRNTIRRGHMTQPSSQTSAAAHGQNCSPGISTPKLFPLPHNTF